MEYFELVGSIAAQREYAAAVPSFVNVPYEIIEQWADWVRDDPRTVDAPSAVYSPEEWVAVREYHAARDAAAAAIPDDFPSLADVQSLPEWLRLTEQAASAGKVFTRRGKLPEDEEITPPS